MENKDLIEEQEYLANVENVLSTKISNKVKETERLKQEVERISIPNFDEKDYFLSCKNKIFHSGRILKELNDSKNNPYFGRMDLKISDDVVENLTMYIGEKSIVLDDITKRNLVYDWRSPVANLYYMNNQDEFSYNETKYELNLKRQIDIENGKINNIYNSYKRGTNINIQDNFLHKVLNAKKDRNEFTDIIRTIQSNQNTIIRDDLFTNSIIQGVAGSGKTVVLLHRLSYILYNYKNINKNKLIFITPSRIFQSKLSKINRSLSLNTIKMLPMEEYYLEKIKTYIPSFQVNIIEKDKDNNELLKYIYSDDYTNYLDNILNDYFKEYKELINNYPSLNFNQEKIFSSLTNNNNILKNTLDNFNYKLNEKEDVLELQKITKKYLSKHNLKELLDIIYNDLKNKYNLKNKKYINNKRISKCYAYTLLWLYMKYGFTTYNNYSFMFIDEMQDYSNNEFKLISVLEKNTHLNLYGDVNQNILPYIEKRTEFDLNNLLKNILHTDKVINYKLEENYRNSKQITTYCNSFLSNKMISMGINSDEVNIKNINKNEIYNNIINNFNKDNIVIITKDIELEELLLSKSYEVYSIKNAKGLEFSKVLVIEEDFNETEKYVAYTRTLDKLFIYKVI